MIVENLALSDTRLSWGIFNFFMDLEEKYKKRSWEGYGTGRTVHCLSILLTRFWGTIIVSVRVCW